MIPIPQDIVRHSLRTDLPFFAMAALVLFAGISAIVLSRLRSRDPLLLWFGVFASLYGIRLFLSNQLLQFASGADIRPFTHAADVITYCIPIPYMVFFLKLLGPGWKDSIAVWLWVQVAFAPAAIALQFLGGQTGAARISNNVLVLIATVIAFSNLMGKAQSLAVKVAVAFFLSFVVVANLGFRIGARDLEPVGFFILLCALAFISARSAVKREQTLIAVEQELQTARRIQSSILPRTLPELNGLRIAARYEPMTAVAGDFYDFIQIDDQRVTILVADVSGHGVPAAMIASMMKVAFADQTPHASDPARILSNLNTTFGTLLDGQFVTAACALIDLSAQTVTYAGAGHPPALLVRTCGEIVELAENGFFLGPFRHATYANTSAPFGPGDKLVLYTDGIIEATVAGGEIFGGDRLREFARDRKAVEPVSFIEQLLLAVSGPVREDDLTVVVAEAH